MNSMNIVLDHRVAVASIVARGAYQPASHPIARIHLLGPIRATSYLGDNILPRRKKARALLAYLCLAPSGKVSRERLASLLWDTSSRERARTSLRQNLTDITSAMGPLAAELISGGRGTITLNVNACWIDARALRSGSEQTRSDLAHLCTGRLLDELDGLTGSFDRWLLSERTRFSERLRWMPTRVASAPAAVVARPAAHQMLPGRNRLRVAVLPFEGRNEREGSLGSSLSHEVAAALARFRWFDVISPASVLHPQSSAKDVLTRDLDYAVDGWISRRGRVIEVSIRLLDVTRSTQPVWSERFKLATDELHRLNEMVTPRVVGSVDPVILHIEGQPKRREHYGATGLLLLAIPLLYSMERNKFQQASDLIDKARKIDPQNAMALAWSAIWHITRAGHGWTQDLAKELTEAEAISLKAIALDPENAEAIGIYAYACAWRRDFEAAIKHFDRSLRLNPNLAFVWNLSAVTHCYIGEPNEALRRLKRYHDLAPLDPYSFFSDVTYAIAFFLKREYEHAVLAARGGVKGNPNFSAGYKPLIAALGHLGRTDEAKPFIGKLLTLEPNFTVERFQQVYPLKHDSDREHYATGLRLAGIPER